LIPNQNSTQSLPILDSVGGIWLFKPISRTSSIKMPFIMHPVKNVVGLDWNTQTNSLFIMQHGRGDLHTLYPDIFTTEQQDPSG